MNCKTTQKILVDIKKSLLITCKILSKAMNVPDLPTPAEQ